MFPRAENYSEVFDYILKEGKSSTSFLTLYDGFEYFRKEYQGKTAVLSFMNTPSAWIGASDPICDPENILDFIQSFFEEAKKHKKAAAILPVSKWVEEELREKFYSLQIGDEPWFDLNVPVKMPPATKQLKSKGAKVEVFKPASISIEGRVELEGITQRWLNDRKVEPLSFLNRLRPWVHQQHKCYFRVLLHGHSVGYLAAVPIRGRKAWYLVDIIRSPDSPLGTTELLVIEAMNHLKKQGAEFVTLGMSPFAPVSEKERAHRPNLYRVLSYLFNRFNFIYGFKSLYLYKEKYKPTHWEPQFMITSGKSVSVRVYRGLFDVVYPKGLFQVIFSSLVRTLRRLSTAKFYRIFLNDEIVPRSPPMGFSSLLLNIKASATIGLMNILFFFTAVDDSSKLRDKMVERYGYSWISFTEDGFFSEQLRVVIASFLHWNKIHLVTNLITLFTAVAFLECVAGSTFMVICYGAGVLLSNPLTSLLIYPVVKFIFPNAYNSFAHEFDVGASLGIFACIGALALFSRYRKSMLISLAAGTVFVSIYTSSLLGLDHLVALAIGYSVGKVYVKFK